MLNATLESFYDVMSAQELLQLFEYVMMRKLVGKKGKMVGKKRTFKRSHDDVAERRAADCDESTFSIS
jgi:hypothetical protein